MSNLHIIAVRITERNSTAIEVQKVLTNYGCYIRIRLGLHDQDECDCSPVGILILQLCSTIEISENLRNDLNDIDGVKAHLVDLSD
ncbi:MAG: hypothetical protein RRZ70_02925 [Synergistaceae bacterium]